jgi:hypothetical protein
MVPAKLKSSPIGVCLDKEIRKWNKAQQNNFKGRVKTTIKAKLNGVNSQKQSKKEAITR